MDNMTVYFENSNGEEREVGSSDTNEGCDIIIENFLKERNYKSYYSRRWVTAKGVKIDVGSHTEFFYIR